LQEDIPFKVLAAGNEPDFRTISDFRKIHIGTLQGLFEQVLGMALPPAHPFRRPRKNRKHTIIMERAPVPEHKP
jgi:hypothetical protein